MKKHLSILAVCGLLLSLASCGSKSENTVLHNQQDTLSWAMGESLAGTAKSGFYYFDMDIVRKAFLSSLKGDKQPLDEKAYAEACEYLAYLSQVQQVEQRNEAEKKAAASQQELFAQLESNAQVKKSADGFYYEVLKAGSGPKAKPGQRVKFHFRSKAMGSNKLIEETFGKREPIVHNLGNPMFPALQKAMAMMNAGSLYRFYFPFEQVAQASGVPANTPVVYEVELYEIYKD